MIQKLLRGKEVFVRAIDKYGAKHQKFVAIEEFQEISKELCKDLRGKPDMEHISEEMADAIIMLYQLLLIYGNEAEVEKNIDFKTKRLLSRLYEKDNIFESD